MQRFLQRCQRFVHTLGAADAAPACEKPQTLSQILQRRKDFLRESRMERFRKKCNEGTERRRRAQARREDPSTPKYRQLLRRDYASNPPSASRVFSMSNRRIESLMSNPSDSVRSISFVLLSQAGAEVPGDISSNAAVQHREDAIFVGFQTRSANLGNLAVWRNRARRRMRMAAASVLPHYAVDQRCYVFCVKPSIFFISWSDLLAEVTLAISGAQLHKNALPSLRTPSHLRYEMHKESTSRDLAVSLFSGALQHGATAALVRELKGLLDKKESDSHVRAALELKKTNLQYAQFHKKTLFRCQQQSLLLQTFIKFAIRNDHLKRLERITEICESLNAAVVR